MQTFPKFKITTLSDMSDGHIFMYAESDGPSVYGIKGTYKDEQGRVGSTIGILFSKHPGNDFLRTINAEFVTEPLIDLGPGVSFEASPIGTDWKMGQDRKSPSVVAVSNNGETKYYVVGISGQGRPTYISMHDGTALLSISGRIASVSKWRIYMESTPSNRQLIFSWPIAV